MGVALWAVGTETQTVARRTIGNGTGYFSTTEVSANAALRTSAVVVAGAAVLAWGWLFGSTLEPRSRRRLRTTVTAAVLLAALLAGLAVATRGDGFEDRERYASARAVVAAMAPAVECRTLTARPHRFVVGAVTCATPSAAATDDGTDDVVIGTWRDEEERAGWLEQTPTDQVYAVVGPTWLAVCELQSTCARIQAAAGGRNY